MTRDVTGTETAGLPDSRKPRVQSSTVLFLLSAFSLAACATSSSGVSGAPVEIDRDASFTDAVAADAPTASADGSGAVADDAGSSVIPANDGSLPSSGDDSGVPEASPGDAASLDGGATDASDASADCGAPGGSYTQTCGNCSVTATTLTCACETETNTEATSSLDLCACPNPAAISNIDGGLTCCANPGGTYTKTCNECATTGTLLGCTCKTDNGGVISSFLSLCSCQLPSQISNIDGILTCQ
jgi:hypothetical protein